MTLPVKTSNARRLLDLFRETDKQTRTRLSIAKCLSDIPRVAIDQILVGEVGKGHLIATNGGYKLTGVAKQKYDQEAAEAVLVPNAFKPRGVQPSWRDNVSRQGSDEFLQWQSKHF